MAIVLPSNDTNETITSQTPSNNTQVTDYATTTQVTDYANNTSPIPLAQTTQVTNYTKSNSLIQPTATIQVTEYTIKTLSLVPRPELKGLTVDYKNAYPRGMEIVVKANVLSGLNVTFTFQVSLLYGSLV